MQRVIPVLSKVSRLSGRKSLLSKFTNPFISFIGTPATRFLGVTTQRMAYDTIERGHLNGLDYRVFIRKRDESGSGGVIVSPFHDIPLYADKENFTCNMVVEIPRWTNSKMEINKEEPMNPIKQDVKKGKVRFVKNCFPHHGYIWNYGALPQTWEDVDHIDEHTKAKGDNDPLDVCEIGQKIQKRGSVIQVKVLGLIALIDEGETDWKIMCIDVTDPLSERLNDIKDVETEMPGFLEATREWFKIYKIPDGKPANVFAFDGEYKNREFALNVIKQTNEQWKKLVSSDEKVTREGICCKNVQVAGSPYMIEKAEAQECEQKSAETGPPEALPEDVDKWHYIPASQL